MDQWQNLRQQCQFSENWCTVNEFTSHSLTDFKFVKGRTEMLKYIQSRAVEWSGVVIISTHSSRSCLLIPLLHLWPSTASTIHSQLFIILSFSQSLTFWFQRHRKIKMAHKWGCVQSWMTNHNRAGACPGLLVKTQPQASSQRESVTSTQRAQSRHLCLHK